MPAYSSRAVAVALGIKPKELDNLLSRASIRGVSRGTRGRSRRISGDSVLLIAIAAEVRRCLGSPWHQALGLADAVARHRSVQLMSGPLTLSLDLDGLLEDLTRRLDEAAEYVVTPPRGHPGATRSSRRLGGPRDAVVGY